METVGRTVDPVIRQAVMALDLLGVSNAEQAQVMMSIWHRRDQLTEDGLMLVLSYYADRGDLAYEREDEEDGRPLPGGVEGYSIGGRY